MKNIVLSLFTLFALAAIPSCSVYEMDRSEKTSWSGGRPGYSGINYTVKLHLSGKYRRYDLDSVWTESHCAFSHKDSLSQDERVCVLSNTHTKQGRQDLWTLNIRCRDAGGRRSEPSGCRPHWASGKISVQFRRGNKTIQMHTEDFDTVRSEEYP